MYCSVCLVLFGKRRANFYFSAALRITINGENVSPLAVNDTNSTIETAIVSEGSVNSSGNLLVNDSDGDETP